MKRILFVVVLGVLSLLSCTSEKTCAITGTLSDSLLLDGSVTIVCNEHDTLDIHNGQFTYRAVRENKKGVMFSIGADSFKPFQFVVLPDTKAVNVHIDEDGASISGSSLAVELYDLQKRLLDSYNEYEEKARVCGSDSARDSINQEKHRLIKDISKQAWDSHPIPDALGIQAANMFLLEA